MTSNSNNHPSLIAAVVTGALALTAPAFAQVQDPGAPAAAAADDAADAADAPVDADADADAPAVPTPELRVEDGGAVPPPPAQDMSDFVERLRDTEDRLDRVETATDLQKLYWTGDYRTVVSGFRYQGPDPGGARTATGEPVMVEQTNTEQWLHRFRVGMRAHPLPSNPHVPIC